MTVGGMRWTFFLVLMTAVTNIGLGFRSFFPSIPVPKCPHNLVLCTLDEALIPITNRTTFSAKVDVAINTDVIR